MQAWGNGACQQLLNLNEGFAQLTRGASADFGQLVGELIQGQVPPAKYT